MVGGKPVKLSTPTCQIEIFKEAKKYFAEQCDLFRAPMPYAFHKASNILMKVEPNPTDPTYTAQLRKIGLLATQIDTKMFATNFYQWMESNQVPVRERHTLSYMSKDAAYLNIGRYMMLRITNSGFSEVPLGTDDVILISAKPNALNITLAELQPHIDRLRDVVGKTTIGLRPDLPMTKYITTRYEDTPYMTAETAHAFSLGRFIFTLAGPNVCSLWPIRQNRGEEGGGKSTQFEIEDIILSGNRRPKLLKLPSKQDGFTAIICNRDYLYFDNIDSLNLADPKNGDIMDLLALIATGGSLPMRQYYTTNSVEEYSLHNHICVTCRHDALASRSDVKRRTLDLSIAPPVPGDMRDKDEILETAFEHRLDILAELVLRVQNILRAYQECCHHKYETVSKMQEYEQWTLRCADYEDTLEATQANWRAYMTTHSESIAQGNPLDFALRLWIGSSPANNGREISAELLFTEIKHLLEKLGLQDEFNHRKSNGFAQALTKNAAALKPLGWSKKKTERSNVHVFSPSEAALKDCQIKFSEQKQAFVMQDSANKYKWKDNPTPMALDDDSWMDDPELRNAPHRQKKVN